MSTRWGRDDGGAATVTVLPDGGRAEFQPGQVVTVFRSRRRAGSEAEYDRMDAEMQAAVRQAPGFVDAKGFVADDGERVTVVTFDSMDSHFGWRDHVRHREAQKRGRATFYAEYSIQVSTCTRATRWSTPGD